MTLKKGDQAPNFSLADTDLKMRTLKDFLGKKTVIASIPGAFTSVCTKELCAFQATYAEYEKLGAQVVILAVDSPFVNKAYAEANKITFPILSDYSRQTVSAYGGVHENFAGLTGYSAPKRSIFALDSNGIVQYAWVNDNPGEYPPLDELREALAKYD